MSANTKIEWADHTFNPWEGCQKVGPGCDHCYAEARNARFAGGQAINWGPGAPRRRTSASNWAQPIKWNKQAEAAGTRCRVFCASLADVFDNEVDPQWRADLLVLILATPNLDWLLLTKRIGNVTRMLSEIRHGADHDLPLVDQLPDNVWIGATVVNQAEADRDIPKLLAVPAARRFLSIEPMLGPVNLTDVHLGGGHGHHEYEPIITGNALSRTQVTAPRVHWVIVGGESGPNARPMHPDWAADLRDQCRDAGVPFLFKQWGEWMPEAAMSRDQRMKDMGQLECLYVKLDGTTHWIDKDDSTEFDAGDVRMVKVGKKAAGRQLDGREWNEVPS